ncbi:MAG: hypothetical protein NNA18_00950 [Nitrospira sp.]|nr:hypothetical protein [Nitrospira sp.]
MTRNSLIRLRRGAISVDPMLPKDDYDRTSLSHRQDYVFGNRSLCIISPEDLVIRKYYRLGKEAWNLGRTAVVDPG